ncbi:MAG: type I secretion system permease/ATPase [Alphaproteobacteria bacterium]|nr:type I secretion system permease/ATPase [Alphaproteobacteria bacterium]
MARKLDQTGDRKTPLQSAVAEMRRIFLQAGVFGLFINLLMLTGPIYMLQIYDRVLISHSVPTLVALTLLVAGLYITLGLLDWLRSLVFNSAGSRFEDLLADEAFERVVDDGLNKTGPGGEDTLTSLRTLRRFFSGQALPALFDLPFAPLFFLVLFMLHWAYGLWALFGAGLLFVLALANRQFSSRALERSEQLERATRRHMNETVANLETLEAMGMRGAMQRKWRGLINESDGALVKSGTSLGAFGSGTKIVRLFLQSAILGLGAWLSILGHSTPGAMIAASILMGRAITPVQQIVTQWRTIVSARSAWHEVQDALDRPAGQAGSIELPPIEGRLSLSNVFAAPPGSHKPMLRQISMDILPGDMIGLLGPSGSGKSSLARVMLGLWPAMHGVVRLDGAEIASHDRARLGPQIGYLPQQVDLISESVHANISRLAETPDSQAIIAAARAADCHEMILSLPEGYDTQVGPGGCHLSAGQRQRIGLARALYGDPQLVILDEPNASLDMSGEQALANALKALKARGASVVIIAHRPNAIAHCNKLAVLKSGQLAAFGPREDVLPKILSENARPAREAASISAAGAANA